MPPTFRTKRIYDPPSPDDGARVLVDRLWPRGVSKERAALDAWMNDASPSDELRKWYAHDVTKWEEFERRYRVELSRDPAAAAFDELRLLAKKGPVTPSYASRPGARCHTDVLLDLL